MNVPIVVATDFSTRSDRALRRATMLAKESRAPLSLVHVVDDDQPQYLIDAQMAASRSILEESARTITSIDGVTTQANVVSGDVFSGILQVAERVGASLIIMGPHRRQLRDAFIGTTAERTIAHSHRPVLMTAGVPSAPYDRALIASTWMTFRDRPLSVSRNWESRTEPKSWQCMLSMRQRKG